MGSITARSIEGAWRKRKFEALIAVAKEWFYELGLKMVPVGERAAKAAYPSCHARRLL